MSAEIKGQARITKRSEMSPKISGKADHTLFIDVLDGKISFATSRDDTIMTVVTFPEHVAPLEFEGEDKMLKVFLVVRFSLADRERIRNFFNMVGK